MYGHNRNFGGFRQPAMSQMGMRLPPNMGQMLEMYGGAGMVQAPIRREAPRVYNQGRNQRGYRDQGHGGRRKRQRDDRRSSHRPSKRNRRDNKPRKKIQKTTMKAEKIIFLSGIPGVLKDGEKHEFLASRINDQPGLKSSNEVTVGTDDYFFEVAIKETEEERKRKYGSRYRKNGVAEFTIEKKDIVALYVVEGDDIENPVIEKPVEEEPAEEPEEAKDADAAAPSLKDDELEPETMTVKELRRALEDRGLYTKGLKAELQERLKEWVQEQEAEAKGQIVAVNDEVDLEGVASGPASPTKKGEGATQAAEEAAGDAEAEADAADAEGDAEMADADAEADADADAGDAPTPAAMNAPPPADVADTDAADAVVEAVEDTPDGEGEDEEAAKEEPEKVTEEATATEDADAAAADKEDAEPTASAADEEKAEDAEPKKVVDLDEPAHPYRLVIALKRDPRQDNYCRRDNDIISSKDVLKNTRVLIIEFTVQGGMAADPRDVFGKLLDKDGSLFGLNQKESFPSEGENDFKSVVTSALASSDSYIEDEKKYWDATSLVEDNKRLRKENVDLKSQVDKMKEKLQKMKDNLTTIKKAAGDCLGLVPKAPKT